jgi:hypothetical protein
MEQLIHTFTTPVREADSGALYIAEVLGRQRSDGRWEGWLEFGPVAGVGLWRTGRETTQGSLDALIYWATGLEPVYLEGAFRRAEIVAPFSLH